MSHFYTEDDKLRCEVSREKAELTQDRFSGLLWYNLSW